MASPKVHIKVTFILAGAYAISCIPFAIFSKDSLILSAVIFFGVFVDFDHVMSFKLERIKDGSWVKAEGEIDWLHTWDGLELAILSSVRLESVLPLLSFIVHMMIDGANRATIMNGNKGVLPLSIQIYFYYKLLNCKIFPKTAYKKLTYHYE